MASDDNVRTAQSLKGFSGFFSEEADAESQERQGKESVLSE